MPDGTRRNVIVTGASGFIGRKLTCALLASPDYADCNLTLIDILPPPFEADDRTRIIVGDLADAAVLDRVFDTPADLVFHLGGILGGAAEVNSALARRVNVDATLDMLDRLRLAGNRPRVVFASSIAVFGPGQTDPVDDRTMPYPAMVYGAHKRMVEIAIEQMSARGWIDGMALRLPGIVARRDADQKLKSAFINSLFHDYAASRAIELPVSPQGTTWLISTETCVDAFVHAGRVPAGMLGKQRAFTLPAQWVCFSDLITGLARHFPESTATVTFNPNEDLDRQFARQPMLATPLADGLGFRHDGDIATLISQALKS